MNILFVTDHEFWLVDRGSRQRISELIRYLSKFHAISVLHVSSSHPISCLPSDIYASYNLKSFSSIPSTSSPSQPCEFRLTPTFAVHLIAQIRRLVFKLFKKLRILSSRSSASAVNLTQTFKYPKGKRVGNIIRSSNADIVIVEYLRLHPFNSLARKFLPNAKILLDAHDVLSYRSQSFSNFGYSHWCHVSRGEESFFLNMYDAIIAISNRDLMLFSRLAPSASVLLAGHPATASVSSSAFSKDLPSLPKSISSRILFLASGGCANLDALQVLLREILPCLYSILQSGYELVIAGSICADPDAEDMINIAMRQYPVVCMGLVDSLAELYDSVDIASNPVRFGGGLKIKNIEALSAGLALVTSTEGSQGLPITDPLSLHITDNPEEHARFLAHLIDDPRSLSLMKQRALASADQFLNPRQVYKPLCDYIDGYWSQEVASSVQL